MKATSYLGEEGVIVNSKLIFQFICIYLHSLKSIWDLTLGKDRGVSIYKIILPRAEYFDVFLLKHYSDIISNIYN